MKILITGATGFIGGYVVKTLLEQHKTVNFLTTRKEALNSIEGATGFLWNTKTEEIDSTCFDGVNTIIHLAGATIANKWTDDYKKIIIKSRVNSANLLYETLKNTPNTVNHFITASAIGIYKSSYENRYTENSTEFNTSFLGDVVKKWEAVADTFNNLNIQVSKVRIGLVLEANNGMLEQILKPAKWGAASAFGNGEQWQSWIHIKDLAAVFNFVTESKSGIYNAVAPNPVSQKRLIKTVTKTIKKPFFLPNIPRIVMRLILGEMHVLLFDSQFVDSSKLETQGFNFEFAHLNEALNDLL